MTNPVFSGSCLLGFAVIAAACALPANASEGALVQPGDRALSCDALATQINELVQQDAAPAPKKKKGGLGFLGRALTAASPILGNVGGTGAMVASQAAAAAQSAQLDAQMSGQMEAIIAPQPTIREQRRERLMGIFEKKGC